MYQSPPLASIVSVIKCQIRDSYAVLPTGGGGEGYKYMGQCQIKAKLKLLVLFVIVSLKTNTLLGCSQSRRFCISYVTPLMLQMCDIGQVMWCILGYVVVATRGPFCCDSDNNSSIFVYIVAAQSRLTVAWQVWSRDGCLDRDTGDTQG